MLATVLFSLLSSHLRSKNLKIKIYKTLILPPVLYGYETCTITLTKKHRLRVENTLLRGVSWLKGEEVEGDWRRLHNEELDNLHDLHIISIIISVIKSKRMWRTGLVERNGEMENAYKTLVGETEGKRPLGRPRRRREIILKYDTYME